MVSSICRAMFQYGFDHAVRVEKYRPVTLDDVVSHKEITGTSVYFSK